MTTQVAFFSCFCLIFQRVPSYDVSNQINDFYLFIPYVKELLASVHPFE